MMWFVARGRAASYATDHRLMPKSVRRQSRKHRTRCDIEYRASNEVQNIAMLTHRTNRGHTSLPNMVPETMQHIVDFAVRVPRNLPEAWPQKAPASATASSSRALASSSSAPVLTEPKKEEECRDLVIDRDHWRKYREQCIDKHCAKNEKPTDDRI